MTQNDCGETPVLALPGLPVADREQPGGSWLRLLPCPLEP